MSNHQIGRSLFISDKYVSLDRLESEKRKRSNNILLASMLEKFIKKNILSPKEEHKIKSKM